MAYIFTGSSMHPRGLGTAEVDATDIARLETTQTRLEQQVAEHASLIERTRSHMRIEMLLSLAGVAWFFYEMHKRR